MRPRAEPISSASAGQLLQFQLMAVQILDAAMGTELAARGLALDAPAWSARAIDEAPELIAAIHADYARAGATLHTANTFRTQPRVLGDGWRRAALQAVRIARDSVPRGHRVLGSMAPVEDCYRPDRSPGEAARAEHAALASALADAGCDLLLCETFAHPVEARVACEEALQTGLPVWLSLSAGPFGELLTPAEVGALARSAGQIGVERVLVNCTSASMIQPYVAGLAGLGLPFGVYANAGRVDEGLGWGTVGPQGPRAYAALARRWVEAGASVVGGCCGTGPLHVRALADAFG